MIAGCDAAGAWADAVTAAQASKRMVEVEGRIVDVSRVTRTRNPSGGIRPALVSHRMDRAAICLPRAEYGEIKFVYGELSHLPVRLPCTAVLRHQALFGRPDRDCDRDEKPSLASAAAT